MNDLAAHYKAVKARMGMAPAPGVVIVPPKRKRGRPSRSDPPPPSKRDLHLEQDAFEFANLMLVRRNRFPTPPLSMRLVILATGQHFGFSIGALQGIARHAPIIRARHVAFYLCRELTEFSLPSIGLAAGGRDHTTIMHGHRMIARAIDAGDAEIIAAVRKIREAIEA